MKTKVLPWIAALTCAAWGFAFLYLGSQVATIFEGMHDFISPATRLVFFVGPLGWLFFSLVGALLIIRFRTSRFCPVLVIGFHSVAIGVTCTLLFTSFCCPQSTIGAL
jgi:hypothetical protein